MTSYRRSVLAFCGIFFMVLSLKEVDATVPLTLWKQLSNVSNSEFIQRYLNAGTRAPTVGQREGGTNYRDVIFTQQGSILPSGRDLVAGIMARPDSCSPRPMTVMIPTDENPHIIRWPNCVSVEQCGGCCGHDLMECAPTQMLVQTVQVIRSRYEGPGSDRLTFVGMENIMLERHLSCACRCKVQQHHCHADRHDYLAGDCRCKCKNDELSITCTGVKVWNEKECGCRCPRQDNCFSDELFSNATCRCELRQARTNTSPTGGRVSPAVSPCPSLRCRVGYEAISVGGQCKCQIATSWGMAGSIVTPRPINRCPVGRCRPGYTNVFQLNRCRCARPRGKRDRHSSARLERIRRVPGHPQYVHV